MKVLLLGGNGYMGPHVVKAIENEHTLRITDTTPIVQLYEPGNSLANEDGYVFSSNVSEIEELVDMLDASRAYQNNVEVISTAKDLMIRTLEVIKA